MAKRSKKSKKGALSCVACGAKCCRYVATQIDAPRRKRDYDNIRWYLLHKNVRVFIDHEDDWYIEFESDCEQLRPDHRCAGYVERPRICRQYGDDDSPCEHHANEEPYAVRFNSAAEFERYLDDKGVKWRWKKALR